MGMSQGRLKTLHSVGMFWVLFSCGVSAPSPDARRSPDLKIGRFLSTRSTSMSVSSSGALVASKTFPSNTDKKHLTFLIDHSMIKVWLMKENNVNH